MLLTTFLAGVLGLNAICVLSEDRFLARVGWAGTPSEPAFGAQDTSSIKAKTVRLINSVRTVMRSMGYL